MIIESSILYYQTLIVLDLNHQGYCHRRHFVVQELIVNFYLFPFQVSQQYRPE